MISNLSRNLINININDLANHNPSAISRLGQGLANGVCEISFNDKYLSTKDLCKIKSISKKIISSDNIDENITSKIIRGNRDASSRGFAKFPRGNRDWHYIFSLSQYENIYPKTLNSIEVTLIEEFFTKVNSVKTILLECISLYYSNNKDLLSSFTTNQFRSENSTVLKMIFYKNHNKMSNSSNKQYLGQVNFEGELYNKYTKWHRDGSFVTFSLWESITGLAFSENGQHSSKDISFIKPKENSFLLFPGIFLELITQDSKKLKAKSLYHSVLLPKDNQNKIDGNMGRHSGVVFTYPNMNAKWKDLISGEYVRFKGKILKSPMEYFEI